MTIEKTEAVSLHVTSQESEERKDTLEMNDITHFLATTWKVQICLAEFKTRYVICFISFVLI